MYSFSYNPGISEDIIHKAELLNYSISHDQNHPIPVNNTFVICFKNQGILKSIENTKRRAQNIHKKNGKIC